MRLQDKVAVVTGSARGIGKAVALRFAEEGAKVVITDVNYESCLAVKEEIEKMGQSALAVKCDITNRAEVTALMQDTVKAFGQIDILVNNAGITRDASFMKMTDEQWNAVLNTNLTAMFICTQEACRYMIERKYGRIVCISSLSANTGNFGQTNYSSSKAGVIGFVKSLSKELPRKGIAINAVAPGFTLTEMTLAVPEDIRKQMVDRIPMGRGGEPREIANVVLFLASDEASYVSGQTICANGGEYV